MAFMAIKILQVTTWISLIITTQCEKFEGKLPDAETLMKLIDTYIKPLSSVGKQAPKFRTNEDEPTKHVFQIINKKIESLKPYLQDNDTNDNADTTIIEFHPRTTNESDSVKNNVSMKLYKYKRIRDIIKVNLDKEMTSDKTKKIILKTIDGLITQLSKSSCTQSNGGDSVITFGNRNSKNLNITMNDWKNMTNMYFNHLNDKKVKDTDSLLAKVEALNDFFINIMNDTVHYNKKQKLKCELVEAARTNLEEKDNKDSCERYKICSDELKVFMKDFYESAKRIVDNTFENYGAMFDKDSNRDNVEERDAVEKVISKLRVTYKRRVGKIMERHILNFELDENKDRDKNIVRIDNFVKDITSQINRNVKNHIETYMYTLKARTMLSMTDDLVANLEHDLVSLENDFIGKNCKYFKTCNGQSKEKNGRRNKSDDFFVKLKLKVDGDLNEILKPNILPFLKSISRADKEDRRNLDNDTFDHLIVTRTTYAITKNVYPKTTKLSDAVNPSWVRDSKVPAPPLIQNPFKELANRSIEIRMQII